MSDGLFLLCISGLLILSLFDLGQIVPESSFIYYNLYHSLLTHLKKYLVTIAVMINVLVLSKKYNISFQNVVEQKYKAEQN